MHKHHRTRPAAPICLLLCLCFLLPAAGGAQAQETHTWQSDAYGISARHEGGWLLLSADMPESTLAQAPAEAAAQPWQPALAAGFHAPALPAKGPARDGPKPALWLEADEKEHST